MSITTMLMLHNPDINHPHSSTSKASRRPHRNGLFPLQFTNESRMEILDLSSMVEDGLDSPFQSSPFPVTPGDVGILRSTILPSFALHSGLSIAAYVVSRATGRVEVKDLFWPSGQVINAWWSAVGRTMYYGNISFNVAWNALSWTQKVLLGGVTAWGLRLFYHIASRSIARGREDPRYEELKKQPGFWNRTFFTQFLPEAAFLTVITLSFTLPFRMPHTTVSLTPEQECLRRTLAVGLFSAGFALEVLADVQLESHREERTDLCREGVWSIVRHPK